MKPEDDDDGFSSLMALFKDDPAPPEAPTSYADKASAFLGATYSVSEDFIRLAIGVVAAYLLLRDGLWHTATELRNRIGQQDFMRRVRDLRSRRWGPLIIERRRVKGGEWEYRMDLRTLTMEIHNRIIKGNPRSEAKKTDAEKAVDRKVTHIKQLVEACDAPDVLDVTIKNLEGWLQGKNAAVIPDDPAIDLLDD